MRASATFSEMQAAAAAASRGGGGCLRGAAPQYRQQMPWLSDGHLQRRYRQRLLELRRRTRSRVANVPVEPEWMPGRRKRRRRRRAGFSKRRASDVSQPLQGHQLCPSSAEPPAIAHPEGAAGIPASAFPAPVWKPDWRTKSSPELGLPPPILLHVLSPIWEMIMVLN